VRNIIARKPVPRLVDHDYAGRGWYFVTFVTWRRRRTLAWVRRGSLALTHAGQIVQECWHDTPLHFPGVALDALVVMPDHVHGIVVLPHRKRRAAGLTPSLGRILGTTKAAAARRIREELGHTGPLWHRNFYDRIVRGDIALEAIRRYIDANPARLLAQLRSERHTRST
jgi:putative transposase